MTKYKCVLAFLVGAGLSHSASAAKLVGIEQYRYDASGNIIEKNIDGKVQVSSYDASNQLLRADVNDGTSKSYQYDKAGRMTVNGAKTFHYGYGDRVIEVEEDTKETELYYNAAGQLVGISTGEVYAWDENVLAAENESAFANEAHLTGGVPAIEADEVIISDYLGNTLAVGGQHFAATSYGGGLEEARFTGKMYRSDIGGFIFHYRNYSPQVMAWNMTDPSGYPDGLNNKQYVGGDPLKNVDPLGLEFSGSVLVTVEVPGEGAVTEATEVRRKYWYAKTVAPHFHDEGEGNEAEFIDEKPGWTDPGMTMISGGTFKCIGQFWQQQYWYWQNFKAEGTAKFNGTQYSGTVTKTTSHHEK